MESFISLNLVTLVVMLSYSTHAAMPCLSKSQFGNVKDTGDYIKASVFDGDDRRTAQEYASEHKMSAQDVEQKYAASGDFFCADQMAQAQVTQHNGNIRIATARHAVYEVGPNGEPTCTLRAAIKSCAIVLEWNGNRQVVHADQIVDSGYKCPSDGEAVGDSPDWIVLTPKVPIDSRVEPYDVNTNPVLKAQAVTAVGKSQDWKFDKRHMPIRHYGDCFIKNVYGTKEQATQMRGDCDSSGWSSGMGAFNEPLSKPVLLGILVSNSEKQVNGKPVVQNGFYNATTWKVDFIPLTGDFLNALGKSFPTATAGKSK